MNKLKLFVAITALLFFSGPFVFADLAVIFTANFDDGTVQGMHKIRRYDDEPTAVTSDSDWPAAFPPPSGSYAIRSADDDNTYYGLGSAIGGPIMFRSAVTTLTLEAKIYLVASTANNENSFALIAIDDITGSVELYYRYGYRNNNMYIEVFNGSTFTELGTDSTTPVTIPGWNTLKMVFEGDTTIRFYVNGNECTFSPQSDTTVSQIQIGMLGFDYNNQRAILGDDFSCTREWRTSVEDWFMY